MGHRRAAPRDPALPLPSSFPISPSSHCLVGLAKGVCCSLNHCSPEPKASRYRIVPILTTSHRLEVACLGFWGAVV